MSNDTIELAATTRYRHGKMLKAMQGLGWTNAELSRRSGITQSSIGDFLNLKRKPREIVANKIQNTFADAGVYVDVVSWWPDRFKGINCAPLEITSFQEIEPSRIEDAIERSEKLKLMDKSIGLLDDRTRDVITRRLSGETLVEVAKKYKISTEMVRQIQFKGLLKTRESIISMEDKESEGGRGYADIKRYEVTCRSSHRRCNISLPVYAKSELCARRMIREDSPSLKVISIKQSETIEL